MPCALDLQAVDIREVSPNLYACACCGRRARTLATSFTLAHTLGETLAYTLARTLPCTLAHTLANTLARTMTWPTHRWLCCVDSSLADVAGAFQR